MVFVAPPSFSPIIDGPTVLNILMSIAKVLQAINFKLTEHIKEGLSYLQLFCSVVVACTVGMLQ